MRGKEKRPWRARCGGRGGSIREADGLGAEFVCLLQEQGAVFVEVFARGSEPEPSAFALQEGDPEGRLQSRDLLRHGGLRDFASLCRFGECAAFYNSRKISEPLRNSIGVPPLSMDVQL